MFDVGGSQSLPHSSTSDNSRGDVELKRICAAFRPNAAFILFFRCQLIADARPTRLI